MSDPFSVENLLHAWQKFARGKKKRNDMAEFSLRLIDNLAGLSRDLQSGGYTHGPYEHRIISDPKRRDIYKATVRDRVVHQTVYTELYERFDRQFIHDSYSCRIGKGHHRALYRLEEFARKVGENNTRPVWVLTGDIFRCFASIDRGILKAILKESMSTSDVDMPWLLDRVIDSFSNGIPLGNITSQLFVNVYLNELDQYVKRTLKAHYFIRYCDDFVILSHDKEFLEDCLGGIGNFLKSRLDLSLNPARVSIRMLSSGVDFLGWVHFPNHRVLRASTRRRMFAAISAGVSPESVHSYLGLLRHGNAYHLSCHIIQS